jgi:hypothetical protein
MPMRKGGALSQLIAMRSQLAVAPRKVEKANARSRKKEPENVRDDDVEKGLIAKEE